jgi:hypothetical protein
MSDKRAITATERHGPSISNLLFFVEIEHVAR